MSHRERRPAVHWPDAFPCVLFVLIAGAPAIIALRRGSRRFSRSLDWGPQRKLLAVAISLVLVMFLAWLFSYVYDSAAHSWADEWW